MRLTLRTLLAYLDDILEPGDASEISRKVEESKFASDLVHRIRNSMRRLRLGTPRVEGRGVGLDANSVSEYLDNTLPPDQVPEFEKVCLESDVHLAEVASCHQILTLVLGQPATVDDSLRTRIYGIESGVDPGRSETPSHAVSATSDAPGASDESPAVSLPDFPVRSSPRPAQRKADYLRLGKGLPLKSFAITLTCGFVLAVVALRAMGPFGPTHPVWQLLFGSNPPVASTVDGGKNPSELPVADATSAESPAKSEASPAASQPTDDAAAGTPLETAGTEAAPRPEASPSATVMNPPGTMPTPDTTPGAANSQDASAGMPTETPAKTATEMPAAVNPAPSTEPSTESAVTTISAGRYISEEQVLGRFDPASGAWFRLPSDQTLVPGDRLLSLPTYRPQIVLAPNVKVTFSGDSAAQILGSGESGIPGLKIPYGRVVVISVDNTPARVHVEWEGRRGLLTLSDANAALAIEVTPYFAEGSDPVGEPRHLRVQLLPASGQAGWQDETGEQQVSTGQMLTLLDSQPAIAAPVASQPPWIESADASDIDLRASIELRRFLTLDRPLNLSLLERSDFRQEEVRALACRCLCSLDLFEPSVKALDEAGQRSYWQAHFEALRAGLQRQPESAARVLADIQKVHAADSPAIFRLLWGYTPEQLQAGAARQLVEGLEHPSMIVRVLSITNLRQITERTYLFRPEQPPSQEKSKILKWRKSLEAGEIRHKSQPAPAATLGEVPTPPPAAAGPDSP